MIPDILSFPLYHGTSTIWRDSIERHGLGGKRIVEKLNAIMFYQRAMRFLKALPEEFQPRLLWQRELLATQNATEAGYNFRHGGGVYLTPCLRTALGYARANKFGSEMLSNCYDVHQIIVAQRRQPAWFGEYPDLLSVFRLPFGKPMIVTVRDVRTSELLMETGDDSFHNLEFLLEQLAGSDEERSRMDMIRARAKQGDVAACRELLQRSHVSIPTREEIMEMYGQQVNFQSKAIIPSSFLDIQEHNE